MARLGGTLFIASMREQGLRRLAAVQVFEAVNAWRASTWAVLLRLEEGVLTVRVELWWPWWLALGLAPAAAWIRARALVLGVLRRLHVEMVTVSVTVGTRRRRPKR